MLKRIALAVMASSLLFACGGEESSGDDECVLDETAVCAGKQCGNVSAQDSCGEMKTVSCGTCGDGTTCQANMCISSVQPTCDLTDEEKAAKCEGKCGTISVQNNCEVMIELDCGTDSCGDGQVCNSSTNTCIAEGECAMSDDEKLAYCAGNVCGAAKVQDHCGNIDYVDCVDASAPVNPMTDFANAYDAETNTYKAGLYYWDEEGTYYTAVVDGPAVYDPELDEEIAPSILIVFKNDISAGTHELAPVTIGSDYSFQITESVHLLILNNSDPGYYYYTTATGSVTISEDFSTYELNGIHLSDMMDPSCYSAEMDITVVIEPFDCTTLDPLAAFESALVEENKYEADVSTWDSNYKYASVETESTAIWLVYRKDIALPASNVTISPITWVEIPEKPGYVSPECEDEVCLIIPGDDYYVASSGSVTINSDETEFVLTNVVLEENYTECSVEPLSFTLVDLPSDCSNIDPLADFASTKNTDGAYAAELGNWNETHYYVEVYTTEDNSFGIIYKNNLTDASYEITAVTLDENSFVCNGDVCIFAMNNVANGYWYTAKSGSIAITTAEDSVSFAVTGAVFTSLIDATCNTSAIDFNMIAELPTTPAE